MFFFHLFWCLCYSGQSFVMPLRQFKYYFYPAEADLWDKNDDVEAWKDSETDFSNTNTSKININNSSRNSSDYSDAALKMMVCPNSHTKLIRKTSSFRKRGERERKRERDSWSIITFSTSSLNPQTFTVCLFSYIR